jgi:hypothetical protein
MHQLSDLENDGASKIERVAKQPAEKKIRKDKGSGKNVQRKLFLSMIMACRGSRSKAPLIHNV